MPGRFDWQVFNITSDNNRFLHPISTPILTQTEDSCNRTREWQQWFKLLNICILCHVPVWITQDINPPKTKSATVYIVRLWSALEKSHWIKKIPLLSRNRQIIQHCSLRAKNAKVFFPMIWTGQLRSLKRWHLIYPMLTLNKWSGKTGYQNLKSKCDCKKRL